MAQLYCFTYYAAQFLGEKNVSFHLIYNYFLNNFSFPDELSEVLS